MQEPSDSFDNAPGLERMLFLQVEEGTRDVVNQDVVTQGGGTKDGDVTRSGGFPDGPAPEMEGTLWLNGPAGFRVGSQRYDHWLDGDGLVGALEFSQSCIKLSQRFIRTEKRKLEAAAGQAIYRTFGTRFPGDQLERRMGLLSPCNVSVLTLGGRVMACGEQGLPIEIDPSTLETLAPFTAGDRLHPVSPFAAHSRQDPHTGEVVTFGISFAAQRPTLHLYRLSPDAALKMRARIDLPFPCAIHDMAMTEHYVVFHVSPYLLDMVALQAGSSVLEALDWQPERGSFVLVVQRQDGAEVARVPVGRGYCLHLLNSFESPDHGTSNRTIVLDAVEYDQPLYPSYSVPELFVAPPLGRPVRWVLDIERELMVSKELLVDDATADLALDFPALLPGVETCASDRAWLLGVSTARLPGRSFFDLLVTVDWEARSLGKVPAPEGWFFGSEPAIARTVDGQHVLLVLGFEPTEVRSVLWFYRIDGPVARPLAELPLPMAVPPRFHSHFVPSSPAEGIG